VLLPSVTVRLAVLFVLDIRIDHTPVEGEYVAMSDFPSPSKSFGAVDTLLVTLNDTPSLATPPTVTTTSPEVAPAGTGTTMLVADQLVGVA
jgi:hypothetical protein